MSAILEAIRRLAEEAKSSPRADIRAAAACGAPILNTIGGVYVLTETLDVLCFDVEANVLVSADERWATITRIQAAKKYPAELGALMPKRPASATTCSDCGGTGVLVRTAICGACSGLGWRCAGALALRGRGLCGCARFARDADLRSRLVGERTS